MQCRYLIYIMMIAAGVLASCGKQLDELRPHNVIDEEQQFANPGGYARAVTGLYAMITGGAAMENNYFGYGDMLMYLGEAHGNNIRCLELGPDKYTDAFNYLNSGDKDRSWTYLFWRGSYYTILHANKILDHVKEQETDPVILQAKAEALFLRAFVYFNLVRCYGRPYYQGAAAGPGVMLLTTAGNNAHIQPARATVKEVYDRITTDLLAAIPLFNKQQTNSFAGKMAAYALLSRVYLYMGGTFRQPDAGFNKRAADCADTVINSHQYRLLTGDDYSNYYSKDNEGNSEDIFSGNMFSGLSSISQLYAYPPRINYSGGLYRPSPELLELLAGNDLRRRHYVKNITPGVAADTLATVKYMYQYTAIYSKSPARFIRLAEVYLNRAEARLKLGHTGAALEDVNTIRNRAGLASVALSGQALEAELLKQRRMELAFEGHNSFDDFRNGLPMLRTYSSVTTGPLTIQPTDPKVLMRVPVEEITLNPNLEQNEQ